MAHFNFVISQNAKWGHDGFYIDRQRMTSSKWRTGKYCFTKKALTGGKSNLMSQSNITLWWISGLVRSPFERISCILYLANSFYR